MKFKRLMALAMAGVMTLAMAGTALAAEHTYDDVTTWELSDEGANGIITKNLECNDGVTLSEAATFDFTIVPKEGVTNPAAVDFSSVTKTVTLAAGSGNGATETGVVIPEDLFTTPGEYTFTIAETAGSLTGMTYSTDTYTLHVYKKNAGAVEYTIENSQGQKANTAAFTNTYRPNIPDDNDDQAGLTVKKAVSGNEEYSKKTTYDFTVKVTYTALTPSGGSYKIGSGDWITIPAPATEGADAYVTTITGTLSKDQTILFKELPQGISYTITENETQNTLGTYFTSCTTTDGKSSQGTEEVSTTYEKQTTSNSITFTNTFKAITPTGLAISVAPFVAMFAAVGAAIALYVAAKRRVR